MRRLLMALPVLLALVHGASAEGHRRVAVVVGAAAYGGRGDLANPTHDAQHMATTLSRLGFEVTTLLDPKAEAVVGAIRALGPAPIDELVVFFSGHGGSIGGQAMLVLNDGAPGRRALREVPLAALAAAAAPLKAGATLFVLDACRSDEGIDVAGLQPGLAQPPKAGGTFFAYSAAPGEVAYDAGRAEPYLSPFTFALSEELLVPGQDFGVVMRKVRARVTADTGGRQLPWSEDSLVGPMVLNEAPSAPHLFALYGRALKGDVAAERDLGQAYLDGTGVAADAERGLALLGNAAAQGDVAAMLSLGAFEGARDRNALRPETRARGWYGRAAAAGSAEAAFRLGEMDRRRVKPDATLPVEALMMYRTASDRGHLDARARLLGNALRVAATNAERASPLASLRLTAADGSVLAMVELGRIYGQPRSPVQDDAEADFWLAKAARAGSTEALLEQAKRAGLGRGMPADQPRAFQLTLQAAQRGDAEAMLFVGRMTLRGEGTVRDPAAVPGWFRKAAEAGDAEALADLGVCYEQGLGVDVDLKQAVALYRQGFELSDPSSTSALAVMYEFGLGVRRNIDRAIGFYRQAAELGDARAEGSLGVLAVQGMLTSVPDPALAVEHLRRAAAMGSDHAYILKLAEMTEQGVGTPADPAAAAKLYQRALDLGDAEAANELGALFLAGSGVAQDKAKAVALWVRAADAGDPAAYANLANSSRHEGTPAGLADAGRWSRRGAEAGLSEAMVMFARDLLTGTEGIARDTDAGFEWLAKALAAGNGWAAGTLAALSEGKLAGADAGTGQTAFALLTKSAQYDNSPLAAEALQQVAASRGGIDLARASKADLEARLSGPERGFAAVMLGLGMERGRFGVPPDMAAAKRYFEIAAAAGEASAWRHLGDLQSHNMLDGATAAEGLADYRKGAELADAGSISNLGSMLHRGFGAPRDDAAAFALFKRAAEQNLPAAMYNLGVAYQTGAGTPVSPEQADEWYTKAVRAGSQAAQAGLASLLLNAPADERDYSRGLYYLAQLAEAGDPDAFTSMDELARNRSLPPFVRERAVYLLRGFQGSPRAVAVLARLVSDGVVTRHAAAYGLAP